MLHNLYPEAFGRRRVRHQNKVSLVNTLRRKLAVKDELTVDWLVCATRRVSLSLAKLLTSRLLSIGVLTIALSLPGSIGSISRDGAIAL